VSFQSTNFTTYSTAKHQTFFRAFHSTVTHSYIAAQLSPYKTTNYTTIIPPINCTIKSTVNATI
jgi:hypothetical protein